MAGLSQKKQMHRLRSTALTCLLLLLPPTGALRAEPLPMWQMPSADGTITLLGSIHFLRETDYPLPAGIEHAYHDADELIMELDLDNIDPFAAQALMEKLGNAPAGTSLQTVLGERDYQKAERQASEIDIDLNALNGREPWYAALLITQLRLLQLGFDPSYGVESQLASRAQRDGKTIIGLETMEDQLGYLDGLSLPAQKQFLLQTLDDASHVQDEMERMVKAWRNGNAEDMEKYLLEGMDNMPEVYDHILVQRNRRWTKTLQELSSQKGDILVVVGAMHLIGKDSVISMLSDAGISVQQVQ